VYIDLGVRVWWCLEEGKNFQLGTYGVSKLQKEQFDAKLYWVCPFICPHGLEMALQKHPTLKIG